jgi:hypothetical protein
VHQKKEEKMKKKKLNLEISEIGPVGEKLNLATGLPGPCGPCTASADVVYGANDVTGPAASGNDFGSAVAHAYYASQLEYDNILEFMGSVQENCGRCHLQSSPSFVGPCPCPCV